MYRGLEHSGEDARLPPVCLAYERGVSLGGVSKSLGLPGLRIGWLCSRSSSLMRRVAERKDYTTICPPAPSEVLAAVALTSGFKPLLSRSRAIVESGLASARAFAAAHVSDGIEWCEPSSGTFAYLRLHGLGKGDASLYCDGLRRRSRLMLVPSALFEEADDDRVRLTYGRLGTAERLERWADDLQTHGFALR